MTISIYELYSIGIGPSSSHTVGPMRAARDFICTLESKLEEIAKLNITVYGSLAFTGIGHGSDKAILMGLEGEKPESINPGTIDSRMDDIIANRVINLLGKQKIQFVMDNDYLFNLDVMLDYHSNAMRFQAFDASGHIIREEIYYSIGGGFIVKNSEIEHLSEKCLDENFAHPFSTAATLLACCERQNLRIKDIMLANEEYWRPQAETREHLCHIAKAMEDCIKKGCTTKGILPGGLSVIRRAPQLYEQLIAQGKPHPRHPDVMNWLNTYALAVNEENAAGGRIVTAPTNGASGIIPSVLQYYKEFCINPSEEGVIEFLLTAGAVGILYKKNASISGAEMGCQGEVGVACSMAAAGLAAALGGTIWQIENAAEIGMEHNLGLTCDPVRGLVQIPCIERNAMGAVKAVNAARLALAEEGKHKVSLDMVINTMREIGENMNCLYKETAKGGLAVNVPEC